MEQGSSSSTVLSDIDAIIAQAMAEYTGEAPVANYTQAPTVNTPAEDEVSLSVETSDAETVVQSTGTFYTEAVVIDNPIEITEAISRNSDSYLVDESTSRFNGASWYDNIRNKAITLAGLGGIGSYVAFLLGRMHPARLSLYDGDRIEGANMSGQLYSHDQIGMKKSGAISNTLHNYSNFYDIRTYDHFDFNNPTPDKIMICGFDSMDARTRYFNVWTQYVQTLPSEERKQCLFIDGRLAAESLQVFCITGDDDYSINKYWEDYLFSDEEADETVCSYKQTSFMAMMIGAIMVNLFVNFCANECNPLVPRDLPFFTEYTAETMHFKVVQ